MIVAAGEGVRVDERGALGVVTLDRPAALNALTFPMVRAIGAQLAAWAADDGIGAVLIQAVPGRAFCAGGDVRAARDAYLEDGLAPIRRFFTAEYGMNWRIGTSPKPWVALMDGVTMGGGVGLSVHGRYRIVTERTQLAMPETAIGMFPDVGGGFALAHMPRGTPALGRWLALTGARLDGAACVALGLATHAIAATSLPALVEAMAAMDAGGLRGAALPALLDHQAAASPAVAGEDALAERTAIERCFDTADLASIRAALVEEGTDWANATSATLARCSPFALALTAAFIERARVLDLGRSLQLEYRIVQRVMEHGDFVEGVRALLVDKDRRPRWRDADMAAVPPATVAACFEPLGEPSEELVLDWRVDPET